MDAIVVTTTKKSSEEACAALADAIAKHHFGILHIHDIGKTLASKGVALDQDVRVYDICNPQQAAEVLARNPLVAAALPCAVAVIGEGTGAKFAFLRPTAVLGLFGEGELAAVAHEIEETVTTIVREAA